MTQPLVVHAACLVCLIGDPFAGAVNCLKCAAYAEPKDALFLVKEEWKTIDDLVLPGVGIISINEAKRHVKNRYLETKLGTHAATDVAKLRKQTFIQPDHRVCLRLAAEKYLLHTEGQAGKRIDGAKPKGVIKLPASDQPVVTRDEATRPGKRQVREVIARREARQTHICGSSGKPRTGNKAHRRQKRLVGKKLALIALLTL